MGAWWWTAFSGPKGRNGVITRNAESRQRQLGTATSKQLSSPMYKAIAGASSLSEEPARRDWRKETHPPFAVLVEARGKALCEEGVRNNNEGRNLPGGSLLERIAEAVER